MDSLSKAQITDIDGTLVNVTDFMVLKQSDKTTMFSHIVAPDEFRRPDISSARLYKNPEYYPLLMFANNKCILDFEIGESFFYYA